MSATASIPKQTQVSLNYWNANTAVDGCEFETIFQEPIIINAGDSINVRNSSLDTSKLSNDIIVLEEDVDLTFEWITYAMMKKTNMDLQNGANAGTFHDCWIYGKDRTAFFNSVKNIDPTLTSRNLFDENGYFQFSIGDTIIPDNTGGETPPAPTPNTPYPSVFTWDMINSTLPIISSVDSTTTYSYQIKNNPTNSIILLSQADLTNFVYSAGQTFKYAEDGIVYPNTPQGVPYVNTGMGAQYWTGSGWNFFNGGDYPNPTPTKIGDATDFVVGTDAFIVSFSASTDPNNPQVPVGTPIYNTGTEFEIRKTGFFANIQILFMSVYDPITTGTNNTWYFKADRGNGDFDDNKIYNMTAFADWTRDPNQQLPPNNYLMAEKFELTQFDPTQPFKINALPQYQYINSASTFLSYDFFNDYKMGVFSNPLSSYVLQSATSYGTLNGGTSRFRTDNPTLETLCNAPYNLTGVGGWNSGSTYPNATGMNAPVVLVDGKTLEPIKRSVVITLKSGSYTKEQIAVAITKRLAQLQAPSSSVNYTDPTTTSFTNPSNDISIINSLCPIELQLSAGLFPPQPDDPQPFAIYRDTYPSYSESAVNPFQCELEMGVDTFGIRDGDSIFPLVYNPLFVFSNLNDPNPPQSPAPPNITPYKQNIPMFMVTNAVINNTNYFDADGTKPPNIPVCFKPLINDFKVRGSNVCLNYQDPDYNGWWGDNNQNPAFADGLPPYQDGGVFYNSFDTNNQGVFAINTNEGEDEAPVAYQTGVPSTSPIQHTMLPCIINMDSDYTYSAGMWGTSEFSILYDSAKDQFSFNFLHTPIVTNSGGTPVPSVVRTRTIGTNPYSNVDAVIADGYDNDQSPKRTDVNDRHSGIILTNLTSKYKSGANANFWEKLGFNISDIVMPSSAFDENGVISYLDFNKYTTNELYSISQNVNVLNSNSSRNNEQLYIRDSFTQFLNSNPQIPTPPTTNQPIPAGFGKDVVYASSEATSLVATDSTSSVLNELGGNILIEIIGYGSGSELQDKDAFAIKSIVSLYYLTGNTFLSSTGDSYTYYHQSTIPQVVSKLKVRLLNPITKKKLTNVLGNNNSIYLTFTQNQQISPPPPPPQKEN